MSSGAEDSDSAAAAARKRPPRRGESFVPPAAAIRDNAEMTSPLGGGKGGVKNSSILSLNYIDMFGGNEQGDSRYIYW